MNLVMINDVILDAPRQEKVLFDRATMFGEGVYEVLRLCNGHPFAYDAHMSRLAFSLAALGLDQKITIAQIQSYVDKAIAKTSLTEAIVYFQVSREVSVRSLDVPSKWTPHFYLTVNPLPVRHNDEIKAISTPDIRWQRCDIKSLNLLGNILAKEQAVKANCNDALLVNGQGNVTESTSASVMMVKNKVLYTAGLNENILPSVTRQMVLQLASQTDLTINETPFTIPIALSSDELFLCGTTTEIVPIIELDGKIINQGTKGPYCTELHQQLLALMYGENLTQEN